MVTLISEDLLEQQVHKTKERSSDLSFFPPKGKIMKQRTKILAVIAAMLISVVAYGATTFTTNYSFNKPGDRDRNYGSLIRDNWDKVDSQIKSNETSISSHLTDLVDAHDASAISTTVGSFLCTTQTDVQSFLECLDGTFDPSTSGVVLIVGAQTITGSKTFSATPIFTAVPSGILNTDGAGVISADSFADLDPLTTKGDLLTYSTTTAVLSIGSDDQILVADSGEATGIKWDNPNPRWRKVTIPYTSLSSGSSVFAITALTLQAGEGIDTVILHHTTAFSGGAVSAYTVEVGQSGNSDKYSVSFDVFQASGNTVRDTSSVMDVPNFGATTDVIVTARSTGAALSAATAGSVDVYIRTFLLP